MSEIPDEITIGDKYGPAMAITNQDDANEYFAKLVRHSMRRGKKHDEAMKLERSNLGYYAGYYDAETRRRVERLFLCEHPVFGAIAERGEPTPQQAIEAGCKLTSGG